MSPYSSSWRVSTSPSFRYMEEPSMPTASLGIRILSSTLHCSQTTSAVMILVVLAMSPRSPAFFSKNTRPVTPSST